MERTGANIREVYSNKREEVVFVGNSGSLSFRDYSHPGDYNSYGLLYINNDFSELAIIVHELIKYIDGNVSYRWDPEYGLLISEPATNRKEALNISNKLIGDLLKPLE